MKPEGFRGGPEEHDMQLLDVSLTLIQRRNRAAFVRKADVPGSRELEPGEKVVLRDDQGDYFAGTVVGDSGDSSDPQYHVHLGVRLPEEYAMLRLGRGRVQYDEEMDVCGPALFDDMQSMLDMLGEAREARERARKGVDAAGAAAVPTQRMA